MTPDLSRQGRPCFPVLVTWLDTRELLEVPRRMMGETALEGEGALSKQAVEKCY